MKEKTTTKININYFKIKILVEITTNNKNKIEEAFTSPNSASRRSTSVSSH